MRLQRSLLQTARCQQIVLPSPTLSTSYVVRHVILKPETFIDAQIENPISSVEFVAEAMVARTHSAPWQLSTELAPTRLQPPLAVLQVAPPIVRTPLTKSVMICAAVQLASITLQEVHSPLSDLALIRVISTWEPSALVALLG